MKKWSFLAYSLPHAFWLTQLWRWGHAAGKSLVSLWHLRGNKLHSLLHRYADQLIESFCLCMWWPIWNRSSPSTHCKWCLDGNRFWLAHHRCPHSISRPDCLSQQSAGRWERSDATVQDQRDADGTANQQRARLMYVTGHHRVFAKPSEWYINEMIEICGIIYKEGWYSL